MAPFQVTLADSSAASEEEALGAVRDAGVDRVQHPFRRALRKLTGPVVTPGGLCEETLCVLSRDTPNQTKPTKPTKAARPIKPINPGSSFKSAKPTKPTNPSEPAKPSKATEAPIPTKPANPFKSTKAA